MANNFVVLRAGCFHAVPPDNQYLKINGAWKTVNKGTMKVTDDGMVLGMFGFGQDSLPTFVAIPGDLHPTYKPWTEAEVRQEHNDMLDLIELEESIRFP